MNSSMTILKRAKGLGLFDIVIAGLSGAIGVEIFILLNYAYFHLAGPAVLYALIFGGIINLLIMLSYSELSAAMPLAGGEYTYIKTAYGGYVGFIFGCFRWLAAIFAASLAAVAFVLQLAYLFSAISPQLQTAIMDQSWLISILVVAVMGFMEVRGSKKIGSLIVIAFILLFVGFIVGGFVNGLSEVNLFSAPLPLGTSGVFAAVVYVFPMFIGTRALVASASGSEKPQKDIPRALIISASLLIPLYLLLAFVAISSVSPSEAIQQIPILNLAANKIFGGYGGILFAAAGMVACLSTLGTALSVQSSISRGMSRDGYFPKILLSVHRRFGTFYVAAVIGSVLIMILSALGAIPFLGYAASFGSLLVFALVNLSLMKLRKTQPYMERPFKTPPLPNNTSFRHYFIPLYAICPGAFWRRQRIRRFNIWTWPCSHSDGLLLFENDRQVPCTNSLRRRRNRHRHLPRMPYFNQPDWTCAVNYSLHTQLLSTLLQRRSNRGWLLQFQYPQ
jgi:basic amino acid/polyamine antiporter, APA family